MADNTKKKKAKQIRHLNLPVCLIALAVGVAVFLLSYFGAMKSFDFWVSDKLYQRPTSEKLDITIIGIDEKTIDELGVFTEWDRSYYADLIDTIVTDEYSPDVIGFDILFTADRKDAADKRFAEACERAGNVVVGAKIEFGKELVVNLDHTASVNESDIKLISWAYPDLKNVTTAGFTNNQIYVDGYARTMLMPFMTESGRLESIAMAVYRKYCEKNDLPMKEYPATGKSALFTYTTESGGVEHYSMCDVLSGKISPANLDGRIVLVGAYATGFQDDFPTPIDRDTKMNGVEIHANIIEAIHSGKIGGVGNNVVISIVYALLAAVLVVLVYLFELPAGAAVTAGFIAAQLITCRILYKNGTYVKLVYFLLPAVIIYLGAIIYRYAVARAAEQRVKSTFKQYLSPDVVEELVKVGADNIKLNGLKREVAVFFIDIRGFTTMSEGLDAETVVKILNEYFELVTKCIFEHQGMLDKFIGDAAMAVFNAPNDLDNYVHRAVNAAWDIRCGFDELNKSLTEKYGKKIDFGIGINCGEATVGNIGSSRRLDYTAIGDTVNTASRLEGKAKAGREIVVSEEVVERFKAETPDALNDKIKFNHKGDIELKGKFHAVPAFSVLGKDEEPPVEKKTDEDLARYIPLKEALEKIKDSEGGRAASEELEKTLRDMEAKSPDIAERYKVWHINHIAK